MGSLGAAVEETKEVWDDIMPGRMAQWLSFYPTEGLSLPSQEVLQAGFEVRGRNWDRFHKLFAAHDLILSATSPRITRPIAERDAAWTTADPKYPVGSFMVSYLSPPHTVNGLIFSAISVLYGL